ncbi:MAG: uroporphyrinogen decarboxylase family protein [Planctomycetota bacterium]|nr:uroporphyrinogen decarboxylase family protein [Planctomycetota bacterium]
MNSFERYMGVLKGQKVDVLPRLPILMAYAAKFIGSNYGAFASDYRVLVKSNRECAEHFGFDQVSTISDPFRETQGFGAKIKYVTDGVPRCPHAPLQDAKDLALLKKPDPHKSARMLDRVRAVEAYRKFAFHKYSILGWVEGPAAEMSTLRTPGNFLMDLMDEPGYCCTLMDICVEAGIAFAAAQLEAGADTIGIGDAIASQVSPQLYEKLIWPREKRLVDGIHARGGIVRLHICGRINHLLPGIAKLGCEIVDLDWQVDIAAARKILPARTALVGNLNPVADVQDSTPAKIKAAVRRIYKTVGNPYMAGAGCEIPVNTPKANLKALCAAVGCGA